MRGQNARYRLELDFLDAVNGAKQQVTLPDGSVLDVTIPAGTRDGQTLRLRGKGLPGLNGGQPATRWSRLPCVRTPRSPARTTTSISSCRSRLRDAVLGGKVDVPTPEGSVTMTVPKWSNTGSVLRLKGKGVARRDGSRGDQYVTLEVMLPAKPDPELERLISQWQSGRSDSAHPTMEA